MTDQSIGTARLDLVVTTDKLDAAIESAKRSVSGMSAAAQAEYNKLNAAEKRRIDSYLKQANSISLTRQEQILFNAALKGTPTHILDELKAKLASTATQAQGLTKAFAGSNKSARELQFAMRGLPAQVTDIFTSLASGQRPLMVLLQQGGQLKDMFGGIVPAARALGSSIAALVNPITLTIAAVAGLALAWKAAADEQDAFDRSLILTGNSAETTTAKLRGMAAEIDASTNVTAGKASDAIAAAAQTGKFTAEQIALVAAAAVNLENATGRAIEKTVSEFVELEKAPVDAILKLNDAVGDGTNVTNFLTEAQIKAIEKFKEQGKEAEAAAVAVKAYADAINDRSGEVVSNLNAWSSLWRSVSSGVREAGDELVNFMRTSAASQAMARSLQRAFLLPGGFVDPDRPNFSGVKAKVTGDPAAFIDSQAHKERKKAEEEFSRLAESNLDKRGKLEAEIKSIRELGAKAGKDDLEIQKQINAARERFAESQPKGGGGRRAPAVRKARELPDFSKNASDELERLAQAEQRATDSFLDMEAQLQGPMAVAIRDHAKRVEELNALAAQSPEASARLSAALELEAQRHAEVAKEIEAQANPMKLLLDDMALELETIGKSNAERAVMIELRRQNIDVASAEGQAALATARAFEAEAEAKQRSIDLMDDFRSGAADALTDFVTGAKSAKEAFADFFDDIARRITQMIAEKWIERAFGAMGSDGSGTQGGGWLASIVGALFGGGGASSGGSGPVSPFAKGAAFNGGVQYFARGDVFDRATAFRMRGGLGVMGEAGPEAIVPLHRGRDGKLGIRMEVPKESAPRVIRGGDTNIYVQERTNRRTQEQIERAAGRGARRGMSRTGA